MHTGIFLCHIFLDLCNYTKLIISSSATYESAIPVQELNLLRGRREQPQSTEHAEVRTSTMDKVSSTTRHDCERTGFSQSHLYRENLIWHTLLPVSASAEPATKYHAQRHEHSSHLKSDQNTQCHVTMILGTTDLDTCSSADMLFHTLPQSVNLNRRKSCI